MVSNLFSESEKPSERAFHDPIILVRGRGEGGTSKERGRVREWGGKVSVDASSSHPPDDATSRRERRKETEEEEDSQLSPEVVKVRHELARVRKDPLQAEKRQ